ncbi:hypothetical protein AB0L65_15565 [Nonomuraea sp. NPDC052116]|uniref:hypothetical protein n=1 Tax=Nonomuraea sp. NPDC052116 TaxID=3155665 RepID=UPI00342A892A
MWRIVLVPVLLPALTLSAAPAPAQAAVAPKKVLIDYRKQGGFAGLSDHVIVYTNGCVRLSHRTGPTVDKCLTGKEERRLRTSLKGLKLGRSEATPQGADFLKYTLVYKKHRVSRYTLTPSWQPVVQQLDKIMVKYWAPD